MLHDVTAATHRGGYRIEVEFDDGCRGIVDFSKYLTRGGVFERFKDPEYFRKFRVDEEAGTLVWGGEVDIAPETLDAQATGKALPAWMESEATETGKDALRPGDASPAAPDRR